MHLYPAGIYYNNISAHVIRGQPAAMTVLKTPHYLCTNVVFNKGGHDNGKPYHRYPKTDNEKPYQDNRYSIARV